MTDSDPFTRRQMLSFGATGLGFLGLGGGLRAVYLPGEVEHDRVTVAQSDDGTLVVEWKEWYNDSEVEPDSGRSSENKPIVTIDNALPGDSGSVSFRLHAQSETESDFELLMRMHATEGAFSENGRTEPEIVAGDSGPPGELQEFVSVTGWYDMNGMIDTADSCNGVRDIGERFIDANPSGDTQQVDGDTLADVTSSAMLGEWTQLDGEPGSADTLECLPVGEDNAICLGLAWELPDDLPGVDDNIIQTDSAEFTIEFRIESCETTS